MNPIHFQGNGDIDGELKGHLISLSADGSVVAMVPGGFKWSCSIYQNNNAVGKLEMTLGKLK